MSNNLENAVLYYTKNLKWPVFPCFPDSKAPMTGNGFKDAATDEKIVKKWWQIHSYAYIGVPTGVSIGYTVVDVDKQHCGLETLDLLVEVNGDLPPHLEVSTPSGGKHLYFKHTPGVRNAVSFKPGIDIRNDGGYVIVPPSNGYKWVINPGTQVAALPEWLTPTDQGRKDNPTFKDEPIPSGARNDTMMRIAGTYRAKHISFDSAYELLKKDNCRCTPPLSDAEVLSILESAYKYPTRPLSVIKGLEEIIEVEDEIRKVQDSEEMYVPKEDIPLKDPESMTWDIVKQAKNAKTPPQLKPTFNNVINLLSCKQELCGAYRYNEFTKDIEIVKYKPWMKVGYVGKQLEDQDLISFRDHLRKYDLQPSNGVVNDAICSYAMDYPFHPVVRYLSGIQWDNTPRIDTWLSTYCHAEDNAYTRYVGAMTLIAACARVDKPGVKYDYMLILEGKQGIKKSSLVAAMGGAWFGEVNIVARDKDTVEKMRGKWIIEVPEMVCFKRQEIESIKAFISNTTDRVRLAYARRAADFPRQNIFIGTFNPDNYPQGYLTDMSGNRRFLPVHVDDIDLGSFIRDRDQLFAEAWVRMQKGDPLYIKDAEVLRLAQETQSSREVYDEMTQEVTDYLNRQMSREHYTSVEIWSECFQKPKGDFSVADQRRISAIMRKLGYHREKKWIDGKSIWAFIPGPDTQSHRPNSADFDDRSDGQSSPGWAD